MNLNFYLSIDLIIRYYTVTTFQLLHTLDADAIQQTSNDFSSFNYWRPNCPTKKKTENNESLKSGTRWICVWHIIICTIKKIMEMGILLEISHCVSDICGAHRNISTLRATSSETENQIYFCYQKFYAIVNHFNLIVYRIIIAFIANYIVQIFEV